MLTLTRDILWSAKVGLTIGAILGNLIANAIGDDRPLVVPEIIKKKPAAVAPAPPPPADAKPETIPFPIPNILEPVPALAPLHVEPVPVMPARRTKAELVMPVGVQGPGACPIDASVLIRTVGKDGSGYNMTTLGSGTAIDIRDGESWIITCQHLFKNILHPTITVVQKEGGFLTEMDGRIVRTDIANDLAIVAVKAELPIIELNDEQLKPGQQVISCGLTNLQVTVNDYSLKQMDHAIVSLDRYEAASKLIETTGMQSPGRSGGGLFLNGKLCGIIQQSVVSPRAPLYIPIQPVRALMERQMLGGLQGLSRVTEVEFWCAPFKCIPCENVHAKIGAGNELVHVTRRIGPAPWMTNEWLAKVPEGGGYPFHRWTTSGGRDIIVYGITSIEQLERNIAENEPIEMGAKKPVEIGEIHARDLIVPALDAIKNYCGADAAFIWSWRRDNAKDALLIKTPPTREDVFGTSGRIEISVKTATNLPVKQIAFNYRFMGGRLFVQADEVEIEIPPEGSFGAEPRVVGSPILIAWTIISCIWNVYELFHPTVDVWLGERISGTAQMAGDQLRFDFADKQPLVRLHWAFFFSFLKVEYNRPITGAVVSGVKAMIEFHKSRIYRDITIPVN